MVKQAGQFYQDAADIEGRGRFPGQDKFNRPVTGSTSTYNNDAANTTLSTQSSASQGHETKILYDLGLMQDNDADGNSTDDDGNGYVDDYQGWDLVKNPGVFKIGSLDVGGYLYFSQNQSKAIGITLQYSPIVPGARF